MNIVRKINRELAISGQITQDQLHQIAEEGYKSVLNLCFADEEGWWADEKENTEFLGLCYANIPTKLENLNHQAALIVFQTIGELPKPILIHCDISIRSAAIVLLYIATKQGIDFEQAWQQTIKLCLLEK
ncbi:beta-lactamase hydrolase domain-containing protein [Anabaena sp. PCC 7108]|uniref:beta-lactamase hydrolase domain-containing protein n=1 Tax=Anabaena sp. PCC 7108 TaxID=163908 RepID=UPI00034BF512|nr:sulfur transferase domain-containing protein [Anabaena sp. PCC 7108]